MQHHQGDSDLEDAASVEDHAESLPPKAESVVDDVRRKKIVTQLAVYSASDDLPTRAWQAGDATQPSVCTPYDLQVAQQLTTLGRHVTILLKLQDTTTGYYYSCKILLQLKDTTTAAEYYYNNRIQLQLQDTSTGYYYNCKILLQIKYY